MTAGVAIKEDHCHDGDIQSLALETGWKQPSAASDQNGATPLGEPMVEPWPAVRGIGRRSADKG
jgi:hypothetical protein